MFTRLAGRSMIAAGIVLAALFTVLDIATKVLAARLARIRRWHALGLDWLAACRLSGLVPIMGGSGGNLLPEIKITRVMNAVAAGTTDQTSSTIDMQNWDGVMFVAAFGTLTATQVTSMYARQGAQSDMSDAADLAGTRVGPLADGDSNKLLVLDVVRPRERYVNCIVDRGTANAVIDGVVAIQYKGRVEPSTQPTTVAFSETHASPAEGTP